VVDIRGRSRLEGVTVVRVDERLIRFPAPSARFPATSLILSVGLIPENELSLGAGVILDPRAKGPEVDEFFRTNVPGIFAAGNVLQVHDLVDFVSLEAEKLADAVARQLAGELSPRGGIEIAGDGTLGYVLPSRWRSRRFHAFPPRETSLQKVRDQGDPGRASREIAEAAQGHPRRNDTDSRQGGRPSRGGFPRGWRRMLKEYTCIMCPRGCGIEANIEDDLRLSRRRARAAQRAFPTCDRSWPIRGATWRPLRACSWLDALGECQAHRIYPQGADRRGDQGDTGLRLEAPVFAGQILIENLGGLGIDVIATGRFPRRDRPFPAGLAIRRRNRRRLADERSFPIRRPRPRPRLLHLASSFLPKKPDLLMGDFSHRRPRSGLFLMSGGFRRPPLFSSWRGLACLRGLGNPSPYGLGLSTP